MIKENTKNKFLGGKLKIFQQKKGFRAGHDSVILAAAISAKEGNRCLELGIGTGVVSLCLAHRINDLEIVGIDNDNKVLKLAKDNISLNGLSRNVSLLKGDLNNGINDFANLKRQSFHQIYSNPPYYLEDEIVFPLNKNKRNAYIGNKDSLKIWIKIALTFVKSKGTITFINHIKNLPEILNIFSSSMGSINVTPIFSNVKKPASRVIISGVRDSREPIKFNQGLVLNNKDGKPTKRIEGIVRNGKALKD